MSSNKILYFSIAGISASIALILLRKSIRDNKYAGTFSIPYTHNQHERGKFTEIVIPKRSPVMGHTHGDSAARRSAGSSAAAAYAYSIGRVPFYLSMSASDQRAGRLGERTMYWSKDFNAESRRASPSQDSLLVMIDVDEHIDDLPSKLHDSFLPTVLYTFQPSTASGIFGDYRYTFNKDNQVVYDVAGGGRYVHQVWDYSADCITIRKKFLGITYAKSFFTIEKRYVDENHQLILLTPLARFGLLGVIFSANVSGNDLTRLLPVKGDYIRLAVTRSEVQGNDYKHLMSTSKIGMYNAATIPMELDDALALAASNSESKLSPFQVKSMVPDIENAEAMTLVEYHRQRIRTPAVRVVVPTDAVNNYTYNATFTTDDKPSVTPFMSPILPDAYAPTSSVESDAAMVKGRITDLKTEAKPLEEKELKYAHEFSNLLVKEVGACIPVGHEEIVDKLSRPSQRRITDEAAFSDYVSTLIKSFMKKEAYQKPSDPRPIATINGKDKYEYSAFTYAVAEMLKKTSWYAFGRKPRGISERVAEVCSNAMHVILTDLSRFDGRVNLSLRQFEEIAMKAMFPEKYWKQMLDLMRRQYGGNGITRLGIKYKNGFNRQSGSPETAIFNTLCNAFMAYVTFREAGCDPEEAYKRLGIYGGDDGMTPDVDANLYIKTAAKFGHVLEADKILKGKKGVSFLARMYSPDVWYGCPDSCADIARALSKFHVTTTNNIKPVDKLFEKAYALYLTDENTPIIGDFVRSVVKTSGKGAGDYKNLLKIWNSEVPKEDQYPNANEGLWMYELIVDQNLDGFNLLEFRAWLEDCKCMEDYLACPAFIDKPEIKPAKVPMKVNDDFVPAEGDAPNIKPTPKSTPSSVHAVYPGKHGPRQYLNPNMAKSNPMGPQPSVESKHRDPINDSLGGRQPHESTQPRVGGRPRARTKTKPFNNRHGSGPLRSGIPTGSRYKPVSTTKLQSDGSTQNAISGAEAPFHHTGGDKTVRASPTADLTTQGIEPNPGPVTNEAKIETPWTNLLDVFGGIKEAYNEIPNLIERFQGKGRYSGDEALAHYKQHFSNKGKFYDAGTPEYEEWSKIYSDSIAHVPAKRLVGIETNPGPGQAAAKPPQKPTKPAEKWGQNWAKIGEQKRAENNKNKSTTKMSAATPAAAAYASTIRTGVPVIKRTSNNKCFIAHTELVRSIAGTANFSTEQVVIQPGLASTFRWLSTQTSGWEKYRFRKLTAIYKTRTGTGTAGTFLLAPDYDATDSPPINELDASSYNGAVDDAPWKTVELKFDMARSKELFIRSGPLSGTQDPKNSDYATLNICTMDGAAVNWGKLYLKYEIDLITPHAGQPQNVGGTIQSGGTGIAAATPFGSTPTVTPGSYVASVNTATVTLQNLIVGNEYVLTVSVTGTVLTNNTYNSTGLTTKTVVAGIINGAGTAATRTTTLIATASSGTVEIVLAATTLTDTKITFASLVTSNF